MALTPLLQAAVEVRARAYAPYSGYAVGAAVQTHAGTIYRGVNVENASYGLTICAERSAIAAAAADGVRPQDLAAVAVVAAGAPGSVRPCGACRQVLLEWSAGQVPVQMLALSPDAGAGADTAATGQLDVRTVAELLPHAFTQGAFVPGQPARV